MPGRCLRQLSERKIGVELDMIVAEDNNEAKRPNPERHIRAIITKYDNQDGYLIRKYEEITSDCDRSGQAIVSDLFESVEEAIEYAREHMGIWNIAVSVDWLKIKRRE